MRYGFYLYRLIVETDPDRMRALDAELDSTYNDYKTTVEEAKQLAPAYASKIAAVAAIFDKAVLDSRPVRAAALANDSSRARTLARGGLDDELQNARQHAIDLAKQMQSAVDLLSDELTAKTHLAIRRTWIVIGLGIILSFSFASYLLNIHVVRELLTLRDSIQSLATGKLDTPIPFASRPNEIGEISRSLRTLQDAARERETHSWVKAEVAATGVRLQAAQDFTSFSASLLSRISESIPLLFAAFYLADDSRSRVSRVGTFALDNPAEPAEFALGEGLVGQAAVERRVLDLSTTKAEPLRVSTGLGTVVAGKLLFIPVVNHDILVGVLELATVSPLSERQQAFLNALLVSVGMNAEILSANITTKKLLETHPAAGRNVGSSRGTVSADFGNRG